MKKRKIENTPPVKTKKNGWWTTVQMIDETLVLNVYNKRKLYARHCVNPEKMEYATLKDGVWTNTKVEDAYGIDTEYWYGYTARYDEEVAARVNMSNDDIKLIREKIEKTTYKDDILSIIASAEQQYARDRRDKAEQNRVMRVNARMNQVPEVPEDLMEWIDKRELGGMNFSIKDRETGKWSCTACGKEFDEKKLIRPDKTKARNNDMITCPFCQEKIKLMTRKKKIEKKVHFCIIQPIDDKISVARHCEALIYCEAGQKKSITAKENVRIILYKNPGIKKCSLYYAQCFTWRIMMPGEKYIEWFDIRNPINRSADYMEYLYDGGIEEALKNTAYEPWTRLFREFAVSGQKLEYNRMMIAYNNENYIRVMELLYRGRFFKLLEQESWNISVWHQGEYEGQLHVSGDDIESVFDIGDRQKINRIREANGGEDMLEWMRWSDKNRQKISDKALSWIAANGIEVRMVKYMTEYFSVEQIMNYVERQRRESYIGKSPREVIEQYNDYISMCEKLQKDTTDEMVYRPRELKRRHDEAVMEMERRRAEIKAEEYSKRFGEAEAVLQEIKEKYEYENGEYLIIVPSRIVDIVTEGNYLHHCAGATDRYFDRIKQHETYICFLRKQEEPDTPYYTVEVEPGGTIRQHRGMYDEEPEIELVKPFLKEWQQVIKKRMKKEDHERAAKSKVLREANIKELEENNNTRVLKGLMEDFMEAEAV